MFSGIETLGADLQISVQRSFKIKIYISHSNQYEHIQGIVMLLIMLYILYQKDIT